MEAPNDGPSPRKQYGSVDDPEQPTSHSNLLPRSSRLRNTSSSSPAFIWAQQRQPQDNTRTRNLQEIQGGGGVSRRFDVAIVCGFAFLLGIGVSWSRISGSGDSAAAPGEVFEQGPTHLSSIPVSEEDENATTLEFTALNFYHVRDGKPGQDYPWLKDVKLIEPHRDTTLAVVGAREGFDYRWEVLWKDTSDSSAVTEVQATATGAVTIVVLTKLDENMVVLEEVDGDGKVTNRLEETVLVKYVRREIRTLTADEKEELLDAMFQLWTVRVDGGNGQELYGEDYADIYAINRIHFMGTTNDTCDHLHDGLGFLVSHGLITNTFEFSLQLVNPKLTVPYWDFTMETTAATELEYDPSLPNTRTELLNSSWFGSSDVENDGMVKDGRWKNMRIPMEREHNPAVIATDIYGKLRSPWSTNDRAFLTRGLNEECLVLVDDYLEWPTCEIHYNLTMTNHDFYSWVWDSLGTPHGTLHLWLGGVMDCTNAYSKTASLVGPDIAESLSFLAVGHRKSLFYNGVWKCEGDKVSVDTKPEALLSDGTCGCLGYDLTQGDDYKFIIPQLTSLEFLIGECSEDVKRGVVELICSGVVALGDMDQSSSTFDPMFWAIHPTIERLWQFAVVTEQVTDFAWADQDVIITNPDGTTTTEYISSYYETCDGHRGSDRFPYEILDNENDGFKIKTGIRSNFAKGNTLTNREVLEAFDPRSNSMNYVYDTFKWDHCEPEGYDFDDAWGETGPSAPKMFYQTDEPLSAVYTNFKRKMAEQMNGVSQCIN